MTVKTRKQSAIMTRAEIDYQRGRLERALAFVVLFVSFLGTMAACGGGWDAYLTAWTTASPPIAATLIGLGIQALLTFLQWFYYHQKAIAWPARLADAGLTALSFGLLFLDVPTFSQEQPLQGELLLSWLIMFLLSLAIAWYPESRLVE